MVLDCFPSISLKAKYGFLIFYAKKVVFWAFDKTQISCLELPGLEYTSGTHRLRKKGLWRINITVQIHVMALKICYRIVSSGG